MLRKTERSQFLKSLPQEDRLPRELGLTTKRLWDETQDMTSKTLSNLTGADADSLFSMTGR